MKITIKNNKIQFKELKVGDVFRKYDGMVFMKTLSFYSLGDEKFNSIRLADGGFDVFLDTTPVEKIKNATLIGE